MGTARRPLRSSNRVPTASCEPLLRWPFNSWATRTANSICPSSLTSNRCPRKHLTRSTPGGRYLLQRPPRSVQQDAENFQTGRIRKIFRSADIDGNKAYNDRELIKLIFIAGEKAVKMVELYLE